VLLPGYKATIINYNPYRYGGYDGKYVQVGPEAVQKAVKYAVQTVEKYFRNDNALGRGEDDPSYWGNGVAQPKYLEKLKDVGETGYFITLITSYLQKE
jgi:hypothetical protein